MKKIVAKNPKIQKKTSLNNFFWRQKFIFLTWTDDSRQAPVNLLLDEEKVAFCEKKISICLGQNKCAVLENVFAKGGPSETQLSSVFD